MHEHSSVLAPMMDNGNVRLRAFSVPTKVPSPHFFHVLLYFYGKDHYERPVLDSLQRSRIELRWTRQNALRLAELQRQQAAVALRNQQMQAQQQAIAAMGRGYPAQYRLPSASALGGLPGRPLLYPSVPSVLAATAGAAGSRINLPLQMTAQQVFQARMQTQANAQHLSPEQQQQYLQNMLLVQQQQAALHHSRLLASEAQQAIPANKMMEVRDRGPEPRPGPGPGWGLGMGARAQD